MAIIEPVLFPFEPNWEEDFLEEREFSTTIITLTDDSEQRAALTVEPTRRFNYLLTEVDAQFASMLGARMWGGHIKQWWAPYWPKTRYLVEDLAPAATVIASFPTAGLGIIDGQGIMLYRSPVYVEVCRVLSHTINTITLLDAVTRSWRGVTNRDRLVPVYRAKMELSGAFEFPDVDWSLHRPTFELEPGA